MGLLSADRLERHLSVPMWRTNTCFKDGDGLRVHDLAGQKCVEAVVPILHKKLKPFPKDCTGMS